jgi:hypothetical protein
MGAFKCPGGLLVGGGGGFDILYRPLMIISTCVDHKNVLLTSVYDVKY